MQRFKAKIVTSRTGHKSYKMVNLLYNNKTVGGVTRTGGMYFSKRGGFDLLIEQELTKEDLASLMQEIDKGMELYKKIPA